MQTIYPSADVYAWAQRIYGPNKRLLITDYIIPCDLGTIQPGESSSRQVQIQANADFVLFDLSYSWDAAGDPGGARIQITDSATGEQFGNSNIPIDNIARSSDHIEFSQLPYPRWIGGNTALNVFVQASAGASDPTDWVVNLHGYLIREY